GQGLANAGGMAWARKLDGEEGRVYALMGDGEVAEGSVWEAAEFIAFHGLSNVCGIIDLNRLGQSGPTMHQHHAEVYERRLQAFGWDTAVDRKSTRLNSSHLGISYAVFCLKKKNKHTMI